MDPREILRDIGFADFRPGQREAVAAAMEDRDVLVVMPTGAGKSLCYQLPALARDDLSIVVSPLVSLMQDQVDALERVRPGVVALVNSQRDGDANRAAIARAVNGEHKILYVAPERFSSPGFFEQLRGAKIGLFVVDEAHCVSQWGHDFRPDYFRLADAARELGAAVLMASTATATPQVAQDIVTRLGLRDPVHVATGFDRPNLSFAVVPCKAKADKERRLVATLREQDALPAIVYAGTRARTQELAQKLEGALGQEVLAYHAGLGREARAAAQHRFMSGQVDVVVATNAFGMGVDKADVRTVCHETVPGSVEAYYQEAGRAGRDGLASRAFLFAESRDKGLHVHFIQRDEVGEQEIVAVARRLLKTTSDQGVYDVALADIGGGTCSEDQVRAILGHLARAGVIKPSPSVPDRARGRHVGDWDGRARAACRTFAAEGQRTRWKQYRSVWAFVESTTCRRAALLRHFGDRSAPRADGPCCDVCDPSLVPQAAAPVRRAAGAAHGMGLDEAIMAVVTSAEPTVGRTRAVEILRGGRSKVVLKYSYDGLPGYGAFAHLSNDEVLGRVDALLQEGRLRSTGGHYPKLEAAAPALA
jgi:ATP-dependent DNA helicase RecQ